MGIAVEDASQYEMRGELVWRSRSRHTHRRQPQECAGIRRFGSSEKSEKSEKSEESAWSATSTATWSAPVPPSSFDAPV